MQFMKLGKYIWPIISARIENDNVYISYIITDKKIIGKVFNKRNKGVLENVQIIAENKDGQSHVDPLVIHIKALVINEYYSSYNPAHGFYSVNLSGLISSEPASKWRKSRISVNITKHKV